jgi:hypothetical protein
LAHPAADVPAQGDAAGKPEGKRLTMNDNKTNPTTTSNSNGDPRLWPIATVKATGIFATTFVQTQTLGYLPFNHLLKHMGLDSDKAATFFSLAMLPWTFKVVAGLMVDGVPLFGSRRRSYLILSALTALGMWLLMGVSPGNFNLLLVLAIGMNAAIVLGSTTSGGLLVEAGQRFNASGRLSSLRVFAQNLGAGLALPVCGYLADHTMSGKCPLGWTSAAAILPLACMFFAAWFLLKEAPLPESVEHGRSAVEQTFHVAASIWRQIKNVLRPQMLLPAALVFFIQAVPTFRSTCFYQYQTETLKYSDAALGWLGLAGYSLLISVWNIGLMIGSKTGPTLYEHVLNKNMNSLIWLNAGVTLAGVVFVFLLPKALVNASERK